MNSGAINIGVKVSLLHPDLHSFGICPGVYGFSVLSFFEEPPYCFP
jgi:hypothetical protein